MNNIVIVGRLTKTPTLTYIPNSGTAVAKATIASDRGYKNANGDKITDFFNIELRYKSAENFSNFCDKGDLVTVVGSVALNSYEKNGEKKIFTQIEVSSWQKLLSTNKDELPKVEATVTEEELETPF